MSLVCVRNGATNGLRLITFGKVHLAAPNILERQFEVDKPNQWWVSDITYIHTQEGFLFLAVVMDLFARNIVGWSMGPRIKDD